MTEKTAPKATSSARSALMVGLGIFLSRISGLVRESIFAHYFGNSRYADALRVAQRIPNFLQNLLGEGALSASFIPVYSRLISDGKNTEAGRLAGTVFTALSLIVSVLVLGGMTFARPLTLLIAPGFDGEKFEMTVNLVRIFFPGIGVLVLSAWCLGILNSHRRFLLPYAAPVVLNFTVIAALLFWGGEEKQQLAEYMAWGVTAGSFLVLCIQIPLTLKLSRPLSLNSDFKSPQFRTVLKNFFPAVTARGVVQISGYIDSMIASCLIEGSVSALSYAQNIYNLPVSLFGMAISAAELPALSSETGTPEEVSEKIRTRLKNALRRVAFFIVPSTAVFVFFGDVIVGSLYQRGEFTEANTQFVWKALAGSSFGLLASTQGRLFSSVFFALRDTKTPMRIALLRLVLTTVLGLLLGLFLPKTFGLEEWGIAGLTASFGLAGWCEYLLLRKYIFKKIGRVELGKGYFLRLWGAVTVATLCGLGLKQHTSELRPLLEGVIICGVFGFVYIGMTMVFKIKEADFVLRKFRRFLPKK